MATSGGTVFRTGTFRLSRIDLGASLWALIALIVVSLFDVKKFRDRKIENRLVLIAAELLKLVISPLGFKRYQLILEVEL